MLKTQAYRARPLPPLMGRAGVGRIKSMAYAYSTEISSRLLSVRLMKKHYLDSPHPSPPHQGRETNSVAIYCYLYVLLMSSSWAIYSIIKFFIKSPLNSGKD
jgi:hypothetical protein